MPKVRAETLSNQIRQAIADSGLTLYRIAKDGKVNAAALTRFMQGKSLTLTSVDRITGVLGLGIVVNAPTTPLDAPQSREKLKASPRGTRTKKTPRRARKHKAGAKP